MIEGLVLGIADMTKPFELEKIRETLLLGASITGWTRESSPPKKK